MWQQEVQGIDRFDDLDIVEHRHPLVKQLEAALSNAKPKNTLHFIKTWAQKEMKELEASDDEEQKPPPHPRSEFRGAPRQTHARRRNAIVMAKIDQNEQWVQFLNKEPLMKNEEAKSRVMINLRKIPFLQNLGWDDINQLVNQAELREYSQDELLVKRGQWIDRLYVLLQGDITKTDRNGKVSSIHEGSNMFMECICSLVQATHNYKIISDKAWICGIQAFKIYNLLQEVSIRKEEFYERILMGVSMFNCLDKEQFYKLICMVKLLPPKRPNEIIIEKDAPVDSLYLVLKGQVLLCKQSLQDQITSFQVYRQGQVIGQNWLIDPTEAQCSVIAKTDTQLAIINRADIEAGISSIQRLLQRKKAKRLSAK